MSQNRDEIIRRDPERVRQLSRGISDALSDSGFPVVAVYLHGSWASDNERGDSDLDLAVLAERRLESQERLHLVQRVASMLMLDCDIDLADLYSANVVFAAQVITGGERVFSAGIEADRFEVKTLATYARLNEERHDILRDIFQRGTIYAPVILGAA